MEAVNSNIFCDLVTECKVRIRCSLYQYFLVDHYGLVVVGSDKREEAEAKLTRLSQLLSCPASPAQANYSHQNKKKNKLFRDRTKKRKKKKIGIETQN